MKILFITDKDVNLTFSGAQVMTNRNYLSFVELFGEEHVDVIELEFIQYVNKLKKLINTIRGYNDFLSPQVVRSIIDKSKHYDSIVLDFSTWGIIAKQLKTNGFKGKIICFFHNIEYLYYSQENKYKSIIKLLKFNCIYLNEKFSCKYADKIVALNQRDANGILKEYNKKVDFIIPISCIDIKFVEVVTDRQADEPIKLLFYGSNFWANVNGIKWFVKNVMPYLSNVKLTIAGNGMGLLKTQIVEKTNIIIYDKIDDLSSLIYDADFVINPIFEGSGMKVKTAEALKYGKNIVSTKEGFEGYDIDFDKVGAMCNTQNEFIDYFKNLNTKDLKKYNAYSREMFLRKYSFEATLELFVTLFDNYE